MGKVIAMDVRIKRNISIDANGCWLWTGYLFRSGYGQIWISGGGDKKRLAHRISYETFIGPVPTNLELDHLCRVRRCVNPDHLEPVTHRENVLRGSSPVALQVMQTHCIRGHLLTGDNLLSSQTKRCCVTCRRNHAKAQNTAVSAAARALGMKRSDYVEQYGWSEGTANTIVRNLTSTTDGDTLDFEKLMKQRHTLKASL